jgi:hypothetical protein
MIDEPEVRVRNAALTLHRPGQGIAVKDKIEEYEWDNRVCGSVGI